MQDLDDIKEELGNLVFSGKKQEAIELLQKRYGATAEEAEQLLKLAIKESYTPVQVVKRFIASTPKSADGRGCKQQAFHMIAIIFGFLAVPLILISIVMYVYNDYQIKHSDLIIGKVTAINTYTSYGEDPKLFPVITYRVGIHQYDFEAPVYSDTPEFEVGEEVELFVHRDDPESVIINTFTQRWFMILLVAPFGLFFLILMLIFFRKSKVIVHST